jgi:hypothetical protein
MLIADDPMVAHVPEFVKEQYTEDESLQDPFEWRPPDLQPGGKFCEDRLKSLRAAAATYPNPEEIYAQGLECLARHRLNYDETGTDLHKLQILWWEFPQEHWDALREGSSMNFLKPPVARMNPNSPMDDEQLQVAAQFVDELLDIDAIGVPPDDRPILTNAPLFCVPKPGQPGQWRVIANMRDGGQNDVVGPDPVYLPRSRHMLDQMYEGGYTAVVDASKFFYQFKTRPADRPYLGLQHPLTHVCYEYRGLPMGAGNSPAMGGRYGLAFVLKKCFNASGTTLAYFPVTLLIHSLQD